jgi:hypothetical protein
MAATGPGSHLIVELNPNADPRALEAAAAHLTAEAHLLFSHSRERLWEDARSCEEKTKVRPWCGAPAPGRRSSVCSAATVCVGVIGAGPHPRLRGLYLSATRTRKVWSCPRRFVARGQRARQETSS